MNTKDKIFIAIAVFLGIWLLNTNSRINEIQEKTDSFDAKYAEIMASSGEIDKQTIETMVGFYEEFQDAVGVYDENVNITKAAFTEIDDRLNTLEDAVVTIIDYLE